MRARCGLCLRQKYTCKHFNKGMHTATINNTVLMFNNLTYSFYEYIYICQTLVLCYWEPENCAVCHLGEHGQATQIRKEFVYSKQNGCGIEGHYIINMHHKFHENKSVPLYQFVGGTVGDKNGGSIQNIKDGIEYFEDFKIYLTHNLDS